jgi:hypothetical protein
MVLTRNNSSRVFSEPEKQVCRFTMASRSKSFIFLHVVEEEQRGCMVHQWVTQGTNGLIDNARRPERASMMRPTINEESTVYGKKICFADIASLFVHT